MRRISTTDFRIARRGTSREINRQIALNLVRSKQPISRAELARLMGVRRGAVSRLVSELMRSGLVFEGAKGQSTRGRKPVHLYIETRRSCVLAADISASRIAVLVTACMGLGVVISGVVDPDGARLRFSPTLGWRDVNILETLQAAMKLPVVVENSVKACVLGQVWAVRGDPPVDGPVAFVNVSDGVGVGIAIDGKLLRGAHNIAGEYGHVPLDVNGPACSCGQKGCWEAYVSKRAVIARYLGTDPSWAGETQPPGATVESIIGRARGGEARALATLRETGHYLGRGFATLVKAIDPRRIYLGGEITAAWDLMAPAAREALRAHALIREGGETEILTVPLEEHPRLRGAAALVNAPAFAAPIVA